MDTDKARRRVEDDADKDSGEAAGRRQMGLGLFLVIAGVFFLAREYGIIPRDLPWFPLILMGSGIFLMIQGFFRERRR